MNKKIKVLWLTNIPSPYRVDFFNEFGKYCDLTVLFEKKASTERNKSWQDYTISNFKAVFLKGVNVGVAEAVCPGIINFLKKRRYDKFFVTNYSDITGMLAIAIMRVRRIPYIIEGDGGFAKSGNGFKEKIKKFLISGANICFSTGKEHDKYYQTYGVSRKRIFHYPFTSISNQDLMDAQKFSPRIRWKEKLGMKEKKIILSVGRFSYNDGYGKGYDILLKVSEQLGPEYGVYIVGDKPTDEFVKLKKEKNLIQVHFIGFKCKKDLAEYYAASDCFVLLTRGEAWGLVINEAMSFGLPIITTKCCIAGTELVIDNKNGYLVDLDDIKNIAEKIRYITNTEANINRFRAFSLSIIQNYTIEEMAKRHMDILSGCEN